MERERVTFEKASESKKTALEEVEENWESESNSTAFHTVYSGRTKLITWLTEENKDLQEKLINKKEELKNTQELLSKFIKFEESIEQKIKRKKFELEDFKRNCLEKSGECDKEKLKDELKEMLEAQQENNFAIKLRERIKKDLVKETLLKIKDLDILCKTQEEIINLEKELLSFKMGAEMLEAKINVINNYNYIEGNQGHVFIGNDIGDNNDFSYINSLDSDFIDKDLVQKVEMLKKEVEELTRLLQQEKLKQPSHEKNDRISQLKKEIERITKLIEKNKIRIVNGYLDFFQHDKALLKKLIIENLKFNKTKKERKPSVVLHKEYLRTYAKLEKEVGEEEMEKVESILTDCEELVNQELELFKKINGDKEFIEDLKKKVKLIESNSFNIQQGNVLINNQIGENANLCTFNTGGNISQSIVGIEGNVNINGNFAPYQAQIEQPPK